MVRLNEADMYQPLKGTKMYAVTIFDQEYSDIIPILA